MINLCVNIDHVATVRQARGGGEPDPVTAAVLCELAGAQGITFHLREDRRHIQERDVCLLKELIQVKLNMEMANTKEMVTLAQKFQPDQVTFVPEKRRELTTEGGLDVVNNLSSLKTSISILRKKGIAVSLFINDQTQQIEAAARSGADAIELHTGEYANAKTAKAVTRELKALRSAALLAHRLKLHVYAGHGLNYQNTPAVLDLPQLAELNIGHSIISRSVFVGITNAVQEMLLLINKQRG